LAKRENGIAKESRNMKNGGFQCIIMKVCVSKRREKGIAEESKHVNCMYYECAYAWLYVLCECVWLFLVILF